MTEPHFSCPSCGGNHFGRATAKTIDGQVVVLNRVACHDERGVQCQWRGIWPLSEDSPTIDHELAAMRAALSMKGESMSRNYDYLPDDSKRLTDEIARLDRELSEMGDAKGELECLRERLRELAEIGRAHV